MALGLASSRVASAKRAGFPPCGRVGWLVALAHLCHWGRAKGRMGSLSYPWNPRTSEAHPKDTGRLPLVEAFKQADTGKGKLYPSEGTFQTFPKAGHGAPRGPQRCFGVELCGEERSQNRGLFPKPGSGGWGVCVSSCLLGCCLTGTTTTPHPFRLTTCNLTSWESRATAPFPTAHPLRSGAQRRAMPSAPALASPFRL